MTDAEAIKRIEQLAISGSVPTDTPAVLAPEGCRVHSLEHLLETPRRMRAQFDTERIDDFCSYVAAQARRESAAVFIDPNGGGARAVLDLGTEGAAEWATHHAALHMKLTPEFEALCQVTERTLSQQALIDWIEDWPHILQPFWRNEEGEHTDMTVNAAIQMIRRIDIQAKAETGHEQHDMSRRRSRFESIEAKNGHGDLPSGFFVRCAVYPDTTEREIETRLSLHTAHDEPKLALRIVGRDALLREVADEVEQHIKGSIDDVTTYVGLIHAQQGKKPDRSDPLGQQ